MYITSILPNEIHEKAAWSIYTPCDAEGDSDLWAFLQDIDPNLKKDAEGMLSLFLYISETGPQNLNDRLCHLINDGIREFKKGKIRILWFYDEGNVVICSHGIKKNYQKIKKEDIKKAKCCRDAYNEAKRANAIQIVKGD